MECGLECGHAGIGCYAVLRKPVLLLPLSIVIEAQGSGVLVQLFMKSLLAKKKKKMQFLSNDISVGKREVFNQREKNARICLWDMHFGVILWRHP